MCGICGWVDWNGGVCSDGVTPMVERLAHRGPDGRGVWSDPSGCAVLGHSRLAVLDPSPRADQPMVEPGSGNVIVVNGEIYNFRQLRETLPSDLELRTSGDTEVLLHLLTDRGVQGLDRCHGMFALALWAPRTRRLLLARDRLGIKPLFWAHLGDGIVFASELPALLAHPRLRRELDAEHVGAWLQLGYLPGTRTLVHGVQRLAPGHVLEAGGDGTVRVRQWYDLLSRVEPAAMSLTAAQTAVAEVVADAVRERLVSDVPLGCFLSGGVDSTLMAAAAVRAGASPQTVTVRFEGGADESQVAARSAAALGVEHAVTSCTSTDLASLLSSWAELSGDPIADPSLLPTLLVSRAARRSLTVALSGDGGDELLAGYPRLRAAPWLDRVRRGRVLARPLAAALPARRWAAKLVAALETSDRWQGYQALQGVWPKAEVERLLQRPVELPWDSDLLRELDRRPDWLRYRLLDTLTFLPHRMLTKVDRASMRVALEVRVPLLDHRVVETLLSLPPALARGKDLLRKVLQTWLDGPQPPRRKRGFELPLARWVRHDLRDRFGAMLASPTLSEIGLDGAVVRQAWEAHLNGRADHGERLLALLVLDEWWRGQKETSERGQ